jgi:hypothetical protein
VSLPLWQRILWVASLLLVLGLALAFLGGYGAEWGIGAAP